MDKIKAITTTFFILVFGFLAVAGFIYVKVNQAKEPPFHEGDCLKMNYPEVEEWQYGMIAKVTKIGKNSYGVKYWIEYGWSGNVGSWPFSQPAIKVACPTETHDQEEAR